MAHEHEPRSKRLSTKAKLHLANGALLLGAISAAAIGGYRTIDEYGKDKEARGAIERGLELDPNVGRPTKEQKDDAKQYIIDLVGNVDESSSEDEVLNVTSRIIKSESELLETYRVLDQEKQFKEKKRTLTDAVGANDLDDANIWTLAAGSAATVGSLVAAFWIDRRKPSNTHQ